MKKLPVILLLLFFSAVSHAQDTPLRKEYDLNSQVMIFSETVDAGKRIELTIKNLKPGYDYSIHIRRSTIEIPVLQIGLSRAPVNQQVFIAPLRQGQTVEVVIEESKDAEKTIRKVTYTTGIRGVWKTSFGVSFIPSVISTEEIFFINDSNVITRNHDAGNCKIDYIPSVFFNWHPEAQAANNFSLSLGGGMGVNIEAELSVFLGASVTYNHNITVNLGMAAYRQSFLKGRYREGQVITQSIDEDALHQKLYKFNPFIAVTFRLGENPFKSNE